MLQVNLDYNNRFSFDTSRVEYRYTVNHIKEAEFKAEEVLSEQDATTRVVNNRHGVRIVFRQLGEIGIFDIQTLLINLVTAMGLLAAATTAVDMTMQYVLPQKEVYSKAKTEDFRIDGDLLEHCDHHGATPATGDSDNVQKKLAADLNDPLLMAAGSRVLGVS